MVCCHEFDMKYGFLRNAKSRLSGWTHRCKYSSLLSRSWEDRQHPARFLTVCYPMNRTWSGYRLNLQRGSRDFLLQNLAKISKIIQCHSLGSHLQSGKLSHLERKSIWPYLTSFFLTICQSIFMFGILPNSQTFAFCIFFTVCFNQNNRRRFPKRFLLSWGQDNGL